MPSRGVAADVKCGWLLALAAAGAVVLGAAGCASSGTGGSGTPRPSSQGIEALHLVAVPMTLNLDAAPGTDGFAVKVFASNSRQPKPLAITKGTLEILMFDGLVKAEALAPDRARRIWSFSPKELRAFERKASIGISYQLTLAWGEAKPADAKITVFARYRGSPEAVVYSAPGVIVLADR